MQLTRFHAAIQRFVKTLVPAAQRLPNTTSQPSKVPFQRYIYKKTLGRLFLSKPSPTTFAFMRFVHTFSRFIFTLSNFTRVKPPHQIPHRALLQPLRLQSMSSIPFLSALFGSSSKPSSNMSYPDQRTDEEWRAILNPSMFFVYFFSQALIC